ncbi:MAG: pseudouridine synthase [Chitinivibrionales bacterium]|nr:pseudouridine synthase [Chitinivibrionales bacterium]MBD3358108.1 pseudouridine synthase [Chitinivibrionales bacterium]
MSVRTTLDQTSPPGDNEAIRLNRYLARHNLGSRRECDRLIAAGKVAVNGAIVTELGTRIDPKHDTVTFEGEPLKPIRPPEYLMYHKPRGQLVTAHDPQGRETIYDALERARHNLRHLKYVGRLDRNSEGLLILTNDGDLVHALTHPRFHVKKQYEVLVGRALKPREIEAMVKEGVESDGAVLHAGAIRPLPKADERGVWYELDLYEGKNRQIRRMFDAVGLDVIRLRRVQFGVVKLRGLKRGAVRPLTERETAGLKKLGHPLRKKPRS